MDFGFLIYTPKTIEKFFFFNVLSSAEVLVLKYLLFKLLFTVQKKVFQGYCSLEDALKTDISEFQGQNLQV